MKKIILTMLLVFTLVGCNKNVEQTTTEDINQVETQQEEQTEKSGDKLKVYASNYPFYDLTKQIAGDKVEVIDITSNTRFHGWEPTARDIADLQNGDLFIYSGNNLEPWAENLVDDEIINGEVLEASQGIELLDSTLEHEEDDHEEEAHNDHDEEEVHDHDEEDAHDHDHGQNDPHIWLSLRNSQVIIENIKNKLSELDPTNKDYYEENYEKYFQELKELDEEYSNKLSNTKKDTIIVSHEAYGYLAKDYNFNQVGIEGINAEGEPSVKQIDEIIKASKDLDATVIFYEHTINPKVAEMIAGEVGAEMVKLNPLESLSEEEANNNEDYLSVMKKNLEGINKGLNE